MRERKPAQGKVIYCCLPLLIRVFNWCTDHICAAFPRIPGDLKKRNITFFFRYTFSAGSSWRLPASAASPSPSLTCPRLDRALLSGGMEGVSEDERRSFAPTLPRQPSFLLQGAWDLNLAAGSFLHGFRLSSPALHRREGSVHPCGGKQRRGPRHPGLLRTPQGSPVTLA